MNGIRFFRTIQVKLIIIYVLLILIAMQLIGVYFISTMKTSLTSTFTNNMNEQANLISAIAAQTLSNKPDKTGASSEQSTEEYLSMLVSNLFSINEAEIQVLDSSGKVMATSQQSHQSYIGKKNTALAVSRALQGIPNNEQEVIDEDGVRKKIIAKPVVFSKKIVGAVYMVASMKELYQTVDRINRIFMSGMLIALGLTGVLGVLLAHTITNPIKGLTRQAAAVAEGRFDQQVPVLGNDEIGRLSEVFNDMTIRLRDALSANEEEKEKITSILANMSDGVVAADERGVVMITNRRAQQMLRVEECGGIHLTELFSMADDQLSALMNGYESSAVIHHVRSDGEEDELMRVTFTPIHKRDKGISGTIAVLQDVTEQERLEQSRREFVANVSHELRTPLTTIKSYAEALNDGALDERELGQRFVGVIRNETERMIRLVTDLLHLSRLDSNQATLRRQQTNVPEMLEEVADRFSFQMRKKAIRAGVRVEDGITSIWLDRDQIDQVLDNLVSNAIKYTLDGGRIEIMARKTDANNIAISVRDTGIGIPKKDLSRIFDRFYRVDKARSRNMGGTGLGLSIAREIVKAHGGTIALDSELNEGTTVTVMLPIQAGGESA
ncbi:PAS domain-containing sensor histidine kinase [Paenibacillus baekrokdamisoli]|uniref:histidine kinase n=2 Tax=Paenibacillus baekrokdamisoli TaxID=1712516 RepID=A0A3G9IY19_9BACL|nr:cell wall metabolism sensor histidine kinase WalK [Paenibacillus baekrokdamisoli]MBB3068582.1 two-component system sensor histidine kinase VicK [Paenibacillus baekrokdamisoli]BBH23416.1 PAS domain-containing sensor histidine kinase [Paenibacillus baekrokdamisoli]